ncbi:hypothetical protein V499_04648 [Pseudogymnoascus sp. VKM F-103]|nr:hypothetical protein V499_04648 [Pseudogymnoascus sp. VKM F-103]
MLWDNNRRHGGCSAPHGIDIAWFGDPIFLGGDYSAAMRNQLGSRLPEFTPSEREYLRQSTSIDAFYRVNHCSTKYTRGLAGPSADDDWTQNIEEYPINSQSRETGPPLGLDWLRVALEGLRKLLDWVSNRYHLPIMITENGCLCPSETDLDTAVHDTFRQSYFGLCLDAT